MTKINGIEQTPKQMVTRLKKELRDIKHTLKNSTDTLSISTAQIEAPLVAKELKYNQNLVKMEEIMFRMNVTRDSNAYQKLSDKHEKLRIQNRDLY